MWRRDQCTVFDSGDGVLDAACKGPKDQSTKQAGKASVPKVAVFTVEDQNVCMQDCTLKNWLSRTAGRLSRLSSRKHAA
jgi:hypothetical protein